MISSSREQRELESLHNEALVLVSKRDSQQTLRKIELLLEKATRLNATKYLGAAYGIKGYVYFGLNETKLAIDNFEKSLGFYARKPDQFFNEIKQTKNSMGVLYKNLGESKKALEILHESIKISEEYYISNSIAYNNIASMYVSQDNFEKALQYFQRAIEVESNSNNSNRRAIIQYLSNIASLYVKTGNLEEADKIYSKTFKYCEENNELEFLV